MMRCLELVIASRFCIPLYLLVTKCHLWSQTYLYDIEYEPKTDAPSAFDQGD